MNNKLWHQYQKNVTEHFLSFRVMFNPFPSAVNKYWVNDSLLKGRYEAKDPGFCILKIKTMEIRDNGFCTELQILRFGRIERHLWIPLKVQYGYKKMSEKTPSSKRRPEFEVLPRPISIMETASSKPGGVTWVKTMGISLITNLGKCQVIGRSFWCIDTV